jgi:hypothetical protein
VRIAGDLVVRATPVGDIGPGDAVVTTVRPEHVETDGAPGSQCNRFAACVDDIAYHGDHSLLRAILPGGAALTIRTQNGRPAEGSDRLTIGWCADRCLAFRGPGPIVPAAGGRP